MLKIIRGAAAALLLLTSMPAVASAQVTWATTAALGSNAAVDGGSDEFPTVATDGAGTWIATWGSDEDLGPGAGTDFDIFYATSIDAGATWDTVAALNSNAAGDTGNDQIPSIATNGSGTWIAVWQSTDTLSATVGSDADIFFSISVDDGGTWSAPAALNSTAPGADSDAGFPEIATDGGSNWIVTWYSDDTLGSTVGSDYDLHYAVSDDNGASWSTQSTVNSNAGTDSGGDFDSSIASDGAGQWIATWYSFDTLSGTIGGDGDILYATSADNGTSWSAVAALNSNATTDSGDDFEPAVRSDGAGTWIANWWSFDTLSGTIGDDGDILFASSVNNGTSWSAAAALNSNAGTDGFSTDANQALATDGLGSWIAIWESDDDLGSTIDTDNDILYSISEDSGVTWSAPAALNSNASSDAGFDFYPAIASDGINDFVAVWFSDDTLVGTIDFDSDILVANGTLQSCGNGSVEGTETCDPSAAGNGCCNPTCDGVLIISTECRGAADICDLAEVCDGASPTCPADGFNSAGISCASDGNGCTDDLCNGAGLCTNVDNTDPCDDLNACTGPDTCSGGACAGSAVVCDDLMPCTIDSCDEGIGCVATTGPIPAAQCIEGAKAIFQINNKDDDAGDKLKWKLVKGDFFEQADLGDPVVSTDYALCVYDQSASTPSLVGQVEINANIGWSSIAPKGFKYKDKTAAEDGVRKVLLKAGADGKGKALITAGGINLPTPPPFDGTSYMDQDPSVIIQLLNSEGTCWSTEFAAAGAKANEPAKFLAKSP